MPIALEEEKFKPRAHFIELLLAGHSTTMDNSDSFSISTSTQLLERKYFHASAVWNVAGIRDRTKRSGDVIISPFFECSDTGWQLIMYPYGEKAGSEKDYADLYLNNVTRKYETSKRTIPTYFKVHICDNAKRTLHYYVSERCIFQSGSKSGRLTFKMRYFTQLEMTNSLVISFSICVEDNVSPVEPFRQPKASKDEKESLRSGCFLSSLSSDFEELYENSQLSDVTLTLGDKEFKAHKSVLSARSKVFAAMFEHDMMENRKNTVDLVQMEAETVQNMLRYIYCGNVRELSSEQALSLYVAADRYDLQELKTFCREVVLSDISTSNVCDIAEVADLHNDESLISVLKSFWKKHGKEVIKTEKWKSIFANQPVLCAKMIEWIFSD